MGGLEYQELVAKFGMITSRPGLTRTQKSAVMMILIVESAATDDLGKISFNLEDAVIPELAEVKQLSALVYPGCSYLVTKYEDGQWTCDDHDGPGEMVSFQDLVVELTKEQNAYWAAQPTD